MVGVQANMHQGARSGDKKMIWQTIVDKLWNDGDGLQPFVECFVITGVSYSVCSQEELQTISLFNSST